MNTHVELPLGGKHAKGRRLLVDLADTPVVGRHSWHVRPHRNTAYAGANVGGKTTSVHRLIVGVLPPGYVVDHINGNGLDNRRCNLRVLTNTDNVRHPHHLSKQNTSGHRGVGCYCGRWRAHITVNRRTIHLGSFDTMEQALAARAEAERIHFKLPN